MDIYIIDQIESISGKVKDEIYYCNRCFWRSYFAMAEEILKKIIMV